MALTAREWLLLPKAEQKRRGKELSSHECFLLRTELSMIHFTENEKKNITKEKQETFINPREYLEGEKEAFNRSCREVFKEMQEDVKKKKNTTNQ